MRSGDLMPVRRGVMSLEETFFVPRISPGYMEPEASMACWNDDGTLTVWVSSQKPLRIATRSRAC